jgi:opacity protein-like surface antigen
MDSKLRHALVLTLVVMAGLTTSMAAQEPPRPAPAPHPFGQLRLGVLSFTPTLNLRNIGFDTNVFNRIGTERLTPDFTATVEPGVEARVTTPRTDARVSSTMSLVYYRKYATERAVNPGVDATVDHRLSGRLSLYGKSGIGYAKERAGLEIDNRPRRLAHASTVGVRIGDRKVELDLHGSYDGVAYDPDALFLNVNLAETMNHTSRGAGAGLTLRLSPYTSVITLLDATATRFEFANDRDTNSYAGSMGLQFHPRAVLAGTASVGYRVLKPLSARTPNYSGFTPRAGLTYRLSDVLTVGVGAQRDVETSFYSERPYFLYTLYEASIRQALFHHLDIGGSIQHTTLEYQRFVTQGLSLPSLPPDVVRMLTASIGMPIGKFRVGWYVQRWERLSEDRPYGANRAGLEISVGKVSMSPRGVFLSGPGR